MNDEEQYAQGLAANWLGINEALKTRQNYEVPWTVFVKGRIYPENLMRLEKNGYEVHTSITDITILTYTGKPVTTTS